LLKKEVGQDVDPSITTWIGLLKAGQDDAAQQLWEQYFPRLVELARDKLRGLSRRETDEEDVALSAFHAFYRAAIDGRIPQLNNREDLWRTLVLITSGKAVDQRRYQLAQKRAASPQEVGTTAQDELNLLQEVIGNEPDPGFAALVAEQCQLLLSRLEDEELRQIAVYRLEGYSNEEIAERQNCSVRTVKRRLALIRRTWEAVAGASGGSEVREQERS
jgi:DNA-directed RNA polymerase specialized sigma24 family protein